MSGHAGDLPYGIRLNGMTGAARGLPTDPTRLAELTERPPGAGPVGDAAGGAGDGSTHRASRGAPDRLRIVPRVLRDVPTRDLSVHVLGRTLPAPVALAPIGVPSIPRPDAEGAAARCPGRP